MISGADAFSLDKGSVESSVTVCHGQQQIMVGILILMRQSTRACSIAALSVIPLRSHRYTINTPTHTNDDL